MASHKAWTDLVTLSSLHRVNASWGYFTNDYIARWCILKTSYLACRYCLCSRLCVRLLGVKPCDVSSKALCLIDVILLNMAHDNVQHGTMYSHRQAELSLLTKFFTISLALQRISGVSKFALSDV